MNFLKNLLKNVLTGVLSFFLSIFLIIMILSFISALFSPDTEEKITVKPKSILHIDNLSIIDDRNSKPSDLKFNFEIPLPIPLFDNSKIEEKISLRTFERIITSAKNDENIEAIYLNFNNVSISFNKAEKVRSILKEFKESKPIYSYSELYSKGAYYLSSVADFIAITILERKYLDTCSTDERTNFFKQCGINYNCSCQYEKTIESITNASLVCLIKILILIIFKTFRITPIS